MSQYYSWPNVYSTIKHEQPGTGCLTNHSHYNLASDVCGENYVLDSQGLKMCSMPFAVRLSRQVMDQSSQLRFIVYTLRYLENMNAVISMLLGRL